MAVEVEDAAAAVELATADDTDDEAAAFSFLGRGEAETTVRRRTKAAEKRMLIAGCWLLGVG